MTCSQQKQQNRFNNFHFLSDAFKSTDCAGLLEKNCHTKNPFCHRLSPLVTFLSSLCHHFDSFLSLFAPLITFLSKNLSTFSSFCRRLSPGATFLSRLQSSLLLQKHCAVDKTHTQEQETYQHMKSHEVLTPNSNIQNLIDQYSSALHLITPIQRREKVCSFMDVVIVLDDLINRHQLGPVRKKLERGQDGCVWIIEFFTF